MLKQRRAVILYVLLGGRALVALLATLLWFKAKLASNYVTPCFLTFDLNRVLHNLKDNAWF